MILPLGQGPGAFLTAYLDHVRPLRRRHGEAYWKFATDGDEAARDEVARIELLLGDLHGDPATAEAIGQWARKPTGEPSLDRCITLLWIEFREAQVHPDLRHEIVRLGLEVEELSTTHRPLLSGRPTTSNELDRVLLHATDEGTRREAWEATRAVGRLLRDRILRLVRLRNEQARVLGARDFFALSLQGQEMDETTLGTVLADLQAHADGPWNRVKGGIDGELRVLRGRPQGPLRPWDYSDRFFQSAPRASVGRSMDGWFSSTRIASLARSYYRSIGLPVDRILAASDLFPRDRKHPHAFCIGVENPDDVRILCNLDGNARWMETVLHELGHAVYNAGIDPALPWILRNPAHTFITEAVAMFFGRMVRHRRWLQDVAGVPEGLATAAADELAESQLVFARWALVVSRFEQGMYRAPEQDLDALWWSLVEELQGVERPPDWDGGDWAAKVHVACYPAYYQNYLLGELFASQLQDALGRELGWGPEGGGTAGDRRVGAFFSRMFGWGQSLPWTDCVVRQTGGPLDARHWARQFGGV